MTQPLRYNNHQQLREFCTIFQDRNLPQESSLIREANMTDQQQTTPDLSPILLVKNIVGALPFQFSKDGKYLMLTLITSPENENDKPDRLALTIQTGSVQWLLGLLFQASTAARKRDLNPGVTLIHDPQRYDIGHMAGEGAPPIEARRFYLQFDTGTDHEISFRFWNVIGIQIADAIKKEVLPRLTAEERQWLKGGGTTAPPLPVG
jgi:hypothetical protein